MNSIEKVMTRRSTHFKLAAAVLALLVVLWGAGSAPSSLWITAVIVIAIWSSVQLGIAYRRHR